MNIIHRSIENIWKALKFSNFHDSTKYHLIRQFHNGDDPKRLKINSIPSFSIIPSRWRKDSVLRKTDGGQTLNLYVTPSRLSDSSRIRIYRSQTSLDQENIGILRFFFLFSFFIWTFANSDKKERGPSWFFSPLNPSFSFSFLSFLLPHPLIPFDRPVNPLPKLVTKSVGSFLGIFYSYIGIILRFIDRYFIVASGINIRSKSSTGLAPICNLIHAKHYFWIILWTYNYRSVILLSRIYHFCRERYGIYPLVFLDGTLFVVK